MSDPISLPPKAPAAPVSPSAPTGAAAPSPLKPPSALAGPGSPGGLSAASAEARPQSVMGAAATANPDLLPASLEEAVQSLETWAVSNLGEAKRNGRLYWLLKIPAIVLSASSGLIIYFESPFATQLAGTAVAILVAVDGLRPPGRLRDIRYRAHAELRHLENRMIAQWRSRPVGANSDEVLRRIIAEAQSERDRISAYLLEVEAPKPQ